MRFRDKFFPYPVIRTYYDDFAESTFDLKISEELVGDYLYIRGLFDLNNTNIIDEIDRGNAKYVIHIEESETMFREAYYFDDNNFEIKIPLDSVRRELEVISFITTVNEINSFKSDDLDIIYEGINVSYDKNNIIGIGSSFKIDVRKEDDEIEGVSSIFLVVPDENIKDTFELVLDKNRVTIKVSDESFKLYNLLSNNYSLTNSDNNIIVLALMVLPAFVETLNILKTSYEGYIDYIWFDSLVAAFKEKDIDLIEEFKTNDFDSYKNAQIIFNGLIHEGLERLNIITLEGED